MRNVALLLVFAVVAFTCEPEEEFFKEIPQVAPKDFIFLNDYDDQDGNSTFRRKDWK